MATPEHLDRLMRGAAEWNAWRLQQEVKVDLEGADLSVARLPELDLRGVNLAKANLRYVSLAGSSLQGGILNGADLNHASLGGALLDDADLRQSDLRYATFAARLAPFREDLGGDPSGGMNSLVRELDAEGGSWRITEQGESHSRFALPSPFVVEGLRLRAASLRKARLDGANLQGTVLSNVDLWGVSFDGALFGQTVLDGDLSHCTGFASIRHVAPTALSHRSLRTIPQPVSEEFLRGCGLSDWEVAAVSLYGRDLESEKINAILYEMFRRRLGAPIQYYSVFISYSHKDRGFAERLHHALQKRGIRCWLDTRDMLPGDDIYEQVDRGIKLWDKMLLCCSKDSLTSWWVDNEIDTAFQKERRLMKEQSRKVLALIALDLDGYLLTDQWQSGKRQQILSRVAVDFTGWEQHHHRFEEQVDRVVRALAVDDMGREPPPPSRL